MKSFSQSFFLIWYFKSQFPKIVTPTEMDQNRAQQAFANSNRLDFRGSSSEELFGSEDAVDDSFDGVAIYDTNVIYNNRNQAASSHMLKTSSNMSQQQLPNVQTPKAKGREGKMYSRQPVSKKNSLKKPITTEYAVPTAPAPPFQRHWKLILSIIALLITLLTILLCFLLIPRRLSLVILPPQKESDNYGISSNNGLLSIDTSAMVNTRIKNRNFYSVQLHSVRISFNWITFNSTILPDFAVTSSTVDRKLGAHSITEVPIPLDFMYSADVNSDPLLQDFLKRCYTDNRGLDIEYLVDFELSHIFSTRKTQTSRFKALLPCPMSSRLISDSLAQLNMTLN